jgi:hypothetical protein
MTKTRPMKRAALPDLQEIMDSGLDLTCALEFWSYMQTYAERPSEYWWRLLTILRLGDQLLQ